MWGSVRPTFRVSSCNKQNYLVLNVQMLLMWHLQTRFTYKQNFVVQHQTFFISVPTGIHFMFASPLGVKLLTFLLRIFAEFSSSVKASIDAFMPSWKYQVKSQFSWFTLACSVAIAHKSHIIWLDQRDSSDHNTHLFVSPHNNCKQGKFSIPPSSRHVRVLSSDDQIKPLLN